MSIVKSFLTEGLLFVMFSLFWCPLLAMNESRIVNWSVFNHFRPTGLVVILRIRIQKVYLLGHRPVQNYTKYNSFKSTMLRVIIIIINSFRPTGLIVILRII